MTYLQLLKKWLKSALYSGLNIIIQIFTILILVIFLFVPLIYWLTLPVDTQIHVELTVDHVSFKVDKSTELKKSIKFHSATITEFNNMQFTPSEMPVEMDLNTVHITGFTEDWPTVTMETATPNTTNFGELHELKITEGAEVEFTVETGGVLGITIYNTTSIPPFVSLQHSGVFQMTTRGCQIAGMDLLPNFMITSLSDYEIPAVDVVGQVDTLKVILELVGGQDVEILMDSQLSDDGGYIVPNGIAIKELSLLRKDMMKGRLVTETAVKEGEISYPAYPGIEPIHFGNSNFMFFDQMENFRIEKIVFDPNENGFRVSLNGLARDSVRSYPQGFPENVREYRLTNADEIVEAGKFYKLMFNMLLWIIPIIIGVVGIVSITRIKLSDDDIDRLAGKVVVSLDSKK